jgi:hypothetical protein
MTDTTVKPMVSFDFALAANPYAWRTAISSLCPRVTEKFTSTRCPLHRLMSSKGSAKFTSPVYRLFVN